MNIHAIRTQRNHTTNYKIEFKKEHLGILEKTVSNKGLLMEFIVIAG